MSEFQMDLIREILNEQLRGVDFTLTYTPILEEIVFETEGLQVKATSYATLFEIVDIIIHRYNKWKDKCNTQEDLITTLKNKLSQEIKGHVSIQQQDKNFYLATFDFRAGLSVDVPITVLYEFIEEEDYVYRLMNITIDNLMERVTKLLLK